MINVPAIISLALECLPELIEMMPAHQRGKPAFESIKISLLY
jgi:hypothetical protein